MWKISLCLHLILLSSVQPKTANIGSRNNITCTSRKHSIVNLNKNESGFPYHKSHCETEFPSKLNIGVMDSPPFLKFEEVRNHQVLSGSGYLKELIEVLAHHINFTYKLIPMKSYGKQLESGAWTGGVNSLIKKKIDIFASDLSMTPRRYMFIDYTSAFASDNYKIFLRKRKSETTLNWMVYWKPINWRCYIVLLAFIAAATLCLRASYKFQLELGNKGKRKTNVTSTVFKVWGIVVSQGMTFESTASSTKIFIVTLSIMAMLICQCFNSVLIAHMTVIEDTKVKTLQDILKEPNFKIGWMPTSILQQEFRNSGIKHEHEVWERVQKFKTGNITNFKKLEKFMDGNSAFLHSEYKFDSFSNYVCDYHAFATINRDNYHIGLQKGSNLNDKLSATIIKLRESGILKRMYKKHKEGDSICLKEIPVQQTKEPVGFRSAVGLFTPLLIGIPASIIAFVMELIC